MFLIFIYLVYILVFFFLSVSAVSYHFSNNKLNYVVVTNNQKFFLHDMFYSLWQDFCYHNYSPTQVVECPTILLCYHFNTRLQYLLWQKNILPLFFKKMYCLLNASMWKWHHLFSHFIGWARSHGYASLQTGKEVLIFPCAQKKRILNVTEH